MRFPSRTFLILGLFAGIVIVWLLWPSQTIEDSIVELEDSSQDRENVLAESLEETIETNKRDIIAEQMVGDRLSALYEGINSGVSANNNRSRLAEFRKWVLEQAAEVASSSIIKFLNTHLDADTFGNFKVGKTGFLKDFPSLRIALLDMLEEINPQAALGYSKVLLVDSQHPEEWAVSLRSLAKYGKSDSDKTYLNNKLSELVLNDNWQETPTSGFLQAFDVVAYSGEIAHLYELEALFKDPVNKAVAHASVLSIDRFHRVNPLVGASLIVSNNDYLDTKTGFRASLMARVDLREEGADVLVTQYLSDSNRSLKERISFVKQFPNLNTAFSHNLITGDQLFTQGEMRSRSVAAYELLNELRVDPIYADIEDSLNESINRLSNIWDLNI